MKGITESRASLRRGLCLLLVLCLAAGLMAGCHGNQPQTVLGEHLLRVGTERLPESLDPHALPDPAAEAVFSLLSMGLVDLTVRDSATGEYQFVYEMADSVTDVTAEHPEDLARFAVTLPAGYAPEDVDHGYVFEIRLNADACWEDGTPITAADYVASMKALLDPEMKNPGAAPYCAGLAALAGAKEYYSFEYREKENYVNAAYPLTELVLSEDGSYVTPEGYPVSVATQDGLRFLNGYSLQNFVEYYGYLYFDVPAYEKLTALADERGRVTLTPETLALLQQTVTKSADWGDTPEDAAAYLFYVEPGERFEFEPTVGLYPVDELCFRYVTRDYCDIRAFLALCTRSFLVRTELYEAGRSYSENGLFVTDYGSSAAKFSSCGPYRIESWNGNELKLVQNEHWYGWLENQGYLVSTARFTVDGVYPQQFATTGLELIRMDAEEQRKALADGTVNLITSAADTGSSYVIPSSRSYSLFFNTNLSVLQKADRKADRNSAVLSDANFRKALSFCLDRDAIAALSGGEPTYFLMSELPVSAVYPAEADPAALFAEALASLSAAGLYRPGEEIRIRLAVGSGPVDEKTEKLAELLSQNVSQAAQKAGFGPVVFVPVGNVANRYQAVAEGSYSLGLACWEGGVLDTYGYPRSYLDPGYYGTLPEAGCWDPEAETLTRTVNGSEETMSFADWSRALTGSGRYAGASGEVRGEIAAALEQAFLLRFYRVPLWTDSFTLTAADGVVPYAASYSPMYGYGGIRLLRYNDN